ncbi:uncharacterized protein LOC114518395 [Dendronephthya gigantea]|uniref:uncharacterized protein LOC114518395 n=1 Tax=Dendronephthya gigantea TaxID=151771 RepID=UPI00106D8A02|nr:uncharacterized protein LOC114518395 [Dendronephthya gigantea]
MSSKNLSATELAGCQRGETQCLLQTCTEDTEEFVSQGKMKNFHKGKEMLEQEPTGCTEDIVIFVKETVESERNEHPEQGDEKLKPMETKEVAKGQEEMADCRSRLEDEVTFAERYPSLAEAEESESDDCLSEPIKQEQERLVLHENHGNVVDESCDICFKILEDNKDQLAKICCSGETCCLNKLSLQKMDTFDDEIATLKESDRTPGNINLIAGGGSAHASILSLSTCHDSLPSSRRSPSKKDLYLDLECRICHDVEGHDLISPCHCAGTSKWVHESCIIRWIRHTKTKQCEICTCPITVKRKKKPIDQWTRPSASCGPCNKLDIWYCFVLALCILIIIGFVVLQSHYDVTDQVETTVIFASIYVLCGMIIMMKARYFWTWFVQRSSFWGNWKNLNEEWKIVEANDANVQSPVSPV